MSLRHEWYIKSVLEHFTGENSKYKDMFYGWDVVNEAVSDGRGTYRNASENSSWWAVYESNEFIINAFRFANKYAPADLELYYNDYNEWVTSKVKGIAQLLQDVKDADGTRIDGMGMQGHYQTAGSPSMEDFKTAATTYAKIVGKIQITELDFKASSAYDGTSATEADENTRLAYRYKELYDTIQELRAGGVNITNMTVWGVIDKNSWLQTSNSVGGASNGNQRQMPLLFNDYYRAKPAYWALVDANKLEPKIKSFDILQGDDFENANAITFGKNDTNVTISPVWSADGMKFQAVVEDATVDAADEITVYLSVNGTITSVTAKRAEGEATDTGYTVVKNISCDASSLFVTSQLKMDFVVTDGNNKIAYNDYTLSQNQKDDYYAKVLLKPFVVVPKGTVENIDGKADEEWDNAVEVPLTISLGAKATATAKLMWDEQKLYVFANVTDTVLDADSNNAHEKDSLEVFIDENNGKTSKYEADDKQYRINYLNEQSFNGTKCNKDNVSSKVVENENGYTIEAAFAWTDITPASGTRIGLELQINDAEEGKRLGTLSWFDTTGSGWEKPGVFGTVLLQDMSSVKPSEPVNPGEPVQPGNPVESGKPVESSQTNNSENNEEQTQTETKTETSNNEPIIIENEVEVMSGSPYSGFAFAEMKLGANKFLRRQSIARFFGTNTILYSHLGNLVGITLDARQMVCADVDLTIKKEVLPLFAEGYETYALIPKKEVTLSFEVGIHVHVGKEFVGKEAYIFQKNLATGQMEQVSVEYVNEIGNVALLTNQMSQVMVLIRK